MADFNWPVLREDWADKQEMSALAFNAYAAVINGHSTALATLYAALNAIVVQPIPPIRFSAPTAVLGYTPTDRAYVARRLVGAHMRVSSAPMGSPLTAEVQHWDGYTWTTLGTLSIAASSVVEAEITIGQQQSVGNLVRLNVTSVGSATAATGVVVDILVA